ncbi:hypothetical protein C1646_750426 [Rhizophagus diaphanus]|nr:hypothetical protein C1646_750426 [Rhizophagus diaphanus] [Rhizophagus sp. MUCL 43196]
MRNQHQVIIDEQEVDQENVIPIGNPIIRRPKGRSPGTARVGVELEALDLELR